MIFSKRFTVRRLLAASMAVAAVAALAGGCSRQSEGERCSIENGDEDWSFGHGRAQFLTGELK